MRHFAMKNTKGRSRGFTLIASLMLMLLMSAVAVGLLMMVNTESRVGNSEDLENNAAYHSAEGAMEKMAADLNGMYASILAPQVGDIQNLSSLAQNDPMVTIRSIYSHTKVDANGKCGPRHRLGQDYGRRL